MKSSIHEKPSDPKVKSKKRTYAQITKDVDTSEPSPAKTSNKRRKVHKESDETKKGPSSDKSEDVKDFKGPILSELGKLMSIYQSSGDKGKVMGYRRAISNIKVYDKPITEAEQMNEIPFVGSGIKKKVAELIAEGKMSKLTNLKEDPKLMALDELAQIWGVGPQSALKLYSSGIKSVEQLRQKVIKNPDLLTANQTIGLKYYEDFKERMPRAEATTIAETIQREAIKIFGKDIIVTACGSYRRGKPTCGDVDCLVTRTDDKPVDGMLEELISHLEKQDFLKERLSVSKKMTDRGCENYMGVGQVKGNDKVRRIDIKVYPKEQYGFALLYFTGSDYFNRSMRLFAEQKGYTLSDHGLVPLSKAKGKIITKDMSISCQTEEEVFKALGFPYKSPAQRDT